jgi:hypothetical protein
MSEEDPSYFSLKKEIEHHAMAVLDRDLLIARVLEKERADWERCL